MTQVGGISVMIHNAHHLQLHQGHACCSLIWNAVSSSTLQSSTQLSKLVLASHLWEAFSDSTRQSSPLRLWTSTNVPFILISL